MNPLIRAIPAPLVRLFAGPYVAGDCLEKSLDAAAALWRRRGLRATLDLLAEQINAPEVVENNLATYLRMVDAVAADTRFGDGLDRPTLSMKASSFTTDPLDRGGAAATARDAVLRISEYAGEHGVDLTLDMEDRHWTDYTLDLLGELDRRGHRHVGAVLQTRLHRTRDDLERLPDGLRVRLVIGIYREPESEALVAKRPMKERMLEFGEILLRRGHFVEFGTHDQVFVRRFVDEVAPRAGVALDRYEVQMLFGVPRNRLLGDLGEAGVGARLYVPFALGWPMAIAYLRRRLDEYPAMMWMVARNLLRWR